MRFMKSIIRIFRSGELIRETDAAPGENLLQSISSAGVFLDSPCGGEGKCGKCLVRLSPDGGKVQACRTQIDSDMSVYLPDEVDMEIAGAGAAEPRAQFGIRNSEFGIISNDFLSQINVGDLRATNLEKPENAMLEVSSFASGVRPLIPHSAFRIPHSRPKAALGVAVDIGTTTVVAHLTDLASGERVATASGVNAQRTYGADVISRIRFCAANGHETLTRLIRGQLVSMIREMCSASGVQSDNIDYVSIAGNTIMEHIAAGYSPVGMGTVPFTPVSLFGEEMPAGEDLGVSADANIYFAPAISSYVGGDITAGMLAAGFGDAPEPAVYVDVGTNGEIVLKAGGTYYCCATAAGPAFEGAEISMGMAAVSGAIDHLKWDNGPEFSVIGGGAAQGICGSGLLDALAILLETGAVDESGRLLGADEIGHGIAKCINVVDGKNAFHIASEGGGVYLTSSDIRKLQLAKSAVAAGIQTLLHHAGVSEGQVRSFALAGGFGSFMDQRSAARIGLFPKSFLPVAKALGNTAGEGAAMALCSETAREALGAMRKSCEYVELSSSPVFNEQFIEQMMFHV